MRTVDKPLLVFVLLLLLSGLFIFLSASLGLLTRVDEHFQDIVTKQLVLLLFGIVVMYAASRISIQRLKKLSLFIFLASIIVTALVFVPALGLTLGGATRWLGLGPFSFQPAEFLKLGFVVYFAAWLAAKRGNLASHPETTVPILLIIGVISAILLAQPNTGLLMIIYITGLAMFIAGGGKLRHVIAFIAIALLGLILLASFRPYVKERLETFLYPFQADELNEGYQIRQSLIAVGSGQITGRGFGQSVQKFDYLPEAIGDSIFAVAAEEFGFIGAATLVVLFLMFALRALRVAARAPDTFSRLLTLGIAILITSQAYINIGAMLGVVPLSGIPIPFVSQGGTAMIFTLFESGLLLAVSRNTTHS